MKCRNNNLIPKGLKLKCPVHSLAARKIIKAASKLLVKKRIQHHRNAKAKALISITQHQEKLQSTLSEDPYDRYTQLATADLT